MGLNQLAYRLMGFFWMSLTFCLGTTALVLFAALLLDMAI